VLEIEGEVGDPRFWSLIGLVGFVISTIRRVLVEQDHGLLTRELL